MEIRSPVDKSDKHKQNYASAVPRDLKVTRPFYHKNIYTIKYIRKNCATYEKE
jgi:hypothetical protein